jgi:hypothetical protein
MWSTSRSTRYVRHFPISTNFDRRVHVVGGCRESRISPGDNRDIYARLWISSSIQVISKNFFLKCESLSLALFETGSRLSRLEANAFSQSGLTSIPLPASVKVIGEFCFAGCGSLASITFETGSRLSRLEAKAFSQSGLRSIHLPASVTVIGEFCLSCCGSVDWSIFIRRTKSSVSRAPAQANSVKEGDFQREFPISFISFSRVNRCSDEKVKFDFFIS